MRARGLIFAIAAALAAAPSAQAPRQNAMAPDNTPLTLGLAGYAKVLCSAVFVSGRAPEEAFRNSGYFFLPDDRQAGVTYSVDRAQRLVRMSSGGITRTAKLYGDQGCIIHQEQHDGIYFTPVAVKTTLPDAAAMPWPMGDAPAAQEPSTGIDRQRLARAVDLAFGDPEGLTAAFVVVHKGQIVAERYMPGITKDTQLESWSMGKSLTATLFALLVKDGLYKIDDPVPVPAWRAPGDPRGPIKIADLLHMSSGLRFIAGQDPDYTSDKGYPDHVLVYTGAIDAFAHSMTRPVQFPANTEGRYRNSDPLLVGWLVKQAVTKRGEEYLTFPQRALFDRIGIRRQMLETDPYGNFLMTGYDYGTARNWARLGLLYLQDGMWQGQRILPEGWTTFVSTPAPAWKQPVYGGLFWVNGDGAWKIPKSAYMANGAGGQRTFIIPSHDLVVVRMGHYRGDRAGMKALNDALAELMLATPPAQAPLLAPPIKPLAETYLRWPLPESAREYGRIDGAHLRTYVDELAAISRKSRDAGNQWWGRITGTPAHAETQEVLAAKFKRLGLTNVRLEEHPLPPSWFPTSWSVRVSQGGQTVALKTAHPVLRASATPPGGLDLDAVYVGLGTPADFAGRDVRGKAVFIYSIPTPSALNHSARTDGAMKLAEDQGAAAILIVLGIPGNFATQLWGSGGEGPNQTKVPWFSLGQDDGLAARRLIETGTPTKVHVELAVELRSNLRPAAVWGVLPGMTDENILVIAHSDGFWEAAVDNASGVSSMLGLIEYFAQVPRERRRRTMTFMVPIGHHVTPDLSLQKLHDTGQAFFAKTALIINAEHVTTTQTYLYGNVLRKSNTLTAHRFFVGRSRRLAELLVDDFRLFGVGLYELPSTRLAVAGDLSKLTEDAPGIEVIESNAFYHSDQDTPDIIPAAGLESITRAYAKLIDDINRLDLKDIVDPLPPPTAPR